MSGLSTYVYIYRQLWIFYELPNSTSIGKSLTQNSNDFHQFHGLKRRFSMINVFCMKKSYSITSIFKLDIRVFIELEIDIL